MLITIYIVEFRLYYVTTIGNWPKLILSEIKLSPDFLLKSAKKGSLFSAIYSIDKAM